MRYAFIKEHRAQWTVCLMTEVLAVSLSGFYSWLKRPQSQRVQDDEVLTEKITMFHCGELGPTGRALPVLEPLHLWLAAHPQRPESCWASGSRKRVARLMRSAGIRGKTKRKFKTTTTSKHQRPKADNLVKQNFAAVDPNTLWASDISYISTAEGWLYLAVTLDLYSELGSTTRALPVLSQSRRLGFLGQTYRRADPGST